MRTTTVTITLAELQDALHDYAHKHCGSQPDAIEVRSQWDKTLIYVPLKPGTVIHGVAFQQSSKED